MLAHLFQIFNDGFEEIRVLGTIISGATPRSLYCPKVSYVNLEQNSTLNPKIILTMVKSDPQLLMELILKSPKKQF
jgi:hypothetical protein